MNTRLKLVAAATMLLAAHGASAANTAAGTVITNQASAIYTESGGGTKTVQSNTVITTVQQVAAVTLSGGNNKNGAASGFVAYPHTVTNTGNGADTFNLSETHTGTATFTGVQFFLDANADGVADNATPITSTGQLPVGGTFSFVAVATLASTASANQTNAMTVKATSAFNGSIAASAVDNTTVTASAMMDLTANQPGSAAPGWGAGAEASAMDTKITTAATPTTFTLYLNNTGGTQDTFNLAVSTQAAFGTTGLPAGWTVVFKDANGQVINSAIVAANSNVKVTAEVTPPAGTAPGTTEIFFRAQSPTSGVQDKLHVALTVAAANTLVELVKKQALDANCDGTIEGSFVTTPLSTGAVPGACIKYEITATNKGATTISAVQINDTVPANTTYFSGNAGLLGNLLAPLVNGLVKDVSVTGFNLAPNESNTLTFSVKINP